MTNREKLRQTIYYIWNMDFLPLDQLEAQVMFKALADYLDVEKYNCHWRDFMDEINCLKANDEKWFNNVFDKYFNNNLPMFEK